MVLQYQVDALTISPPEADGVETKEDLPPVEEHNTNTATVIEDPMVTFTDRQTTERQTSLTQNPEDEIQLTDAESDQEISIIQEQDESNDVGSPKSDPEDIQNDFWEKSITKLHLITNKTKENGIKIKEDTGIIKNKVKNEESNRNREVIKESNEEIKVTVHSSPTKNKEKKLKKQPSSNEDKTYNISNKSSPVNEKHKTNMKIQNSVHNIIKSGLKEKVLDNTAVVDTPRKLDKTKVENETKRRKRTTKLLANTDVKKPSVEKITIGRPEAVDEEYDEGTYTVESGRSSPDNTDCEISSLTDLTEDRESKSPAKYSLSPGEHKSRATHSDSCLSPSAQYSLSEGEIQVATVRRRSYDDKMSYISQPMAPAPKMDETLQAITEELARCKRLLFCQRSQDNGTSALM